MRLAWLAVAVLVLVGGRASAQEGGPRPRIPPPGYPVAYVDRPLVLPRGGLALSLDTMGFPTGARSPSTGARDVGLDEILGGSVGLVRRVAASFAVPFHVLPDGGVGGPTFSLRVRLVPRTVELGLDTSLTVPSTSSQSVALGLGLPLQAHLAGRALVRLDPRYTVFFAERTYHQVGARLAVDVRLGRRGDVGLAAGLYGGGSSATSPTYQLPFELRGGGTVAPGRLPRLDVFGTFGFPHLLYVTSAGAFVVRQDWYLLVQLRLFFLARADAP
ncbi:MAG: hypothetical protein U0230_19370 [Polyangiales bacterium]